MPTTLPLDQLIADPSVHARTRIRPRAIREYAASYREGDTLPPLDVFKSPDGRMFLADGFHRYYGARAAGQANIAVELFEGNVREATRFACGANARHGVPRTREDKCFEIAAMLCEPEFAGASEAEIAKTCRVSRQLVGKVKPHATDKAAFKKHIEDEAERRTLAREDRQIARKKAKAEAKASPPPPPPVPDRPLTPQEEAMAALARAAEAADLARKALAECGRAYPEASRMETLMALCEARCHLDELLPAASSPAPRDESLPQTLALLKEFGVDLQAAPQPEKLHAPIPTRSVSEAHCSHPLPPQLDPHQPEKLRASYPAPSHAWGGLGRGAEACFAPANPKSYMADLQPEKLHPAPLDLPADRRIPSETLAQLFAPKPVHPMIAALSEGTIRNVPEVLPIHAKAASAQPFANPLLPRQPEKLHPAPDSASSRPSRRDRKKRRRDRPSSSRSPPAD